MVHMHRPQHTRRVFNALSTWKYLGKHAILAIVVVSLLIRVSILH